MNEFNSQYILYVYESQWAREYVKIDVWAIEDYKDAITYTQKLKNRFPEEKFVLIKQELILV